MQNIFASIINKGYSHIFTNFEIVFFKKFENNILN